MFFAGNVDVVVCDGFIGNIALKLSEGLVEHIGGMLKKAIKSSVASQIGYALSKRGVRRFSGSAPIIPNTAALPCWAFAGITVIGHGRSNPNAIKNAIRVAAELCRSRVNEKIEEELSAAPAVAARG